MSEDSRESSGSAFAEISSFALPVGTGMKDVEPGAGAEFSPETVRQLHERLDQFDAVRTRGEVESRSAHLGGFPSH